MTPRGGIRILAAAPLGAALHLLVALAPALTMAAPVEADRAQQAATTVLTQFYPGDWQFVTLRELQDLDGAVTAYAVVFQRAENARAGQTCEAFIQAALNDPERDPALRYHCPVLTGANRFATVFIGADDTEPVILACQLGLPHQLVQQSFALEEARAAHPENQWRNGRLLFLGMFDEVSEIVPVKSTTSADTRDALVVDLRTRTVQTLGNARTKRAQRTAAPRDPAFAAACRQAWAAFPTSSDPATALIPIESERSLDLPVRKGGAK